MNQRIRVLQELGEQLERTLASEPSNGRWSQRVKSARASHGGALEPDRLTASPRRQPDSIASQDQGRRHAKRNRLVSGFATILAAAITIAIAAGSLVLLGGHHSPPATSAASRTVNPTITSEFAAFRRPRVPSDAVPKHLKFACNPVVDLHGMQCFVDQRQYTIPRGLPNEKRLAAQLQLAQSRQKHFAAQLQLDQSRRFTLPGGLGKLWLIPAGKWLCGLVRIPSLFFYKPFPGTMMCELASRVLASPPLTWPGYFFGVDNAPYPHHGYLIGVEPDRIVQATITYPGGRETTILHQGLLLGCVGMGAYDLTQTTNTGATLNNIRVGGAGTFHPVSCPQFHLAAGTQPTTTPAKTVPARPPTQRNATITDCLTNRRLTRQYSKKQLQHALSVLPAATRKYTNCGSVINQALRSAH